MYYLATVDSKLFRLSLKLAKVDIVILKEIRILPHDFKTGDIDFIEICRLANIDYLNCKVNDLRNSIFT